MNKTARYTRLPALRSSKSDSGVSLVEILVYIALAVVVFGIVSGVIINSLSSTQRFTDASSTQSQVNQAASTLQRDISASSTVEYASETRVELTTRMDGRNYDVHIFGYIPGGTNDMPTELTLSSLPDYPALLLVRQEEGSSASVAPQVLVAGWDPEGYVERPLFRYFDGANSEVEIEDAAVGRAADISRVQFNIAAAADGRASFVQVESSATLRSIAFDSYTPGDPGSVPETPECPANFAANVTVRTNVANISWNAPVGATSYTVYRYNTTEGNRLEGSFVIPNPDTTSYTDNDLTWGTTYRYAIQAAGPGGVTGACATANVTVVPEAPQFVNINPNQASITATQPNATSERLNPAVNEAYITIPAANTQNVERGSRYTVARNRTNQVAWTSEYGAASYNVYRGTDLIGTVTGGNLHLSDPVQRNFGDVTAYTVRAVNAGGESAPAPLVTLISPPVATTTFTVTADDTSRHSQESTNVISRSGAAAANTNGFMVGRNTTSSASATCSSANQTFDSRLNMTASMGYMNDGYLAARPDLGRAATNSIDWGTSTCYAFRAVNAAGQGGTYIVGNWSTTDPGGARPAGIQHSGAMVNQAPGYFSMTDISGQGMRRIDTGRALPRDYEVGDGPSCWSSPSGRGGYSCQTDQNLNSVGGGPGGYYGANKSALGLFGHSNNQDAQIRIRWSESFNSRGGYDSTRFRHNSWTYNQTAGLGGDSTANCAFAPSRGDFGQGRCVVWQNLTYSNGEQSVVYGNEAPGSWSIFAIRAEANNGRTRFATTSGGNWRSYMTPPDIPSQLSTLFQSNPASRNGRVAFNADINPQQGFLSYTHLTLQNFGANNNGLQSYCYQPTVARMGTHGCGTAGSVSLATEPSARAGDYGVYGRNYLTWTSGADSFSSWGEQVGRAGYTNGLCSRYCNTRNNAWYNNVIGHPYYWAGTYGRYFSDASTLVTRNGGVGNLTPVPIEYNNVGEGGTICSALEESSTEFTNANCATGTGIPRTPTNFRLNGTSTASTVGVTWNAVAGATGYEIVYSVAGSGDQTFTITSGSSTSYNVPRPEVGGTAATVRIRAYNDSAASTNLSNALTIAAPTLSAPANLRVLSGNGTGNITYAWNSAASAASYNVETTVDGVVSTTNVTAQSYTVTVPTPGSAVSVRVQTVAANNATSAWSAAVASYRTQDAPLNLRITGVTMGSNGNNTVAFAYDPPASGTLAGYTVVTTRADGVVATTDRGTTNRTGTIIVPNTIGGVTIEVYTRGAVAEHRSAPATLQYNTPPTSASNISINPAATNQLLWTTTGGGSQSYRVAAFNPTTGALVGSATTTSTATSRTYLLTSLSGTQSGQTYEIRIFQVISGSGNSVPSNSITWTRP